MYNNKKEAGNRSLKRAATESCRKWSHIKHKTAIMALGGLAEQCLPMVHKWWKKRGIVDLQPSHEIKGLKHHLFICTNDLLLTLHCYCTRRAFSTCPREHILYVHSTEIPATLSTLWSINFLSRFWYNKKCFECLHWDEACWNLWNGTIFASPQLNPIGCDLLKI